MGFQSGPVVQKHLQRGKFWKKKRQLLLLSKCSSASLGFNGTNISVVGNSVVVWQQAQLRVSGEMFLVAIILGKD